jgi:hypothetical protein
MMICHPNSDTSQGFWLAGGSCGMDRHGRFGSWIEELISAAWCGLAIRQHQQNRRSRHRLKWHNLTVGRILRFVRRGEEIIGRVWITFLILTGSLDRACVSDISLSFDRPCSTFSEPEF